MEIISDIVGEDEQKGLDHLNDNGIYEKLEDNIYLKDKLALYGYHSMIMKINSFIKHK